MKLLLLDHTCGTLKHKRTSKSNKHMKQCSASFVITIMATITKTQYQGFSEDVEKLESSYTTGGNVNCYYEK